MNPNEHLMVCVAEEGVEIAREAADLLAGELVRAGLGVSKVATKSLRFGVEDRNVLDPTGPTNAERLVDEANDLLAVLSMLAEAGVIPAGWQSEEKQAAKRQRVRGFMDYARRQGALGDWPPAGDEGRPEPWEVRLTVLPSPIHGHGLFAVAPFRAGDMVLRFAGREVNTEDMSDEEVAAGQWQGLAPGRALVPRAPGSLFSRVNHAPNPQANAWVNVAERTLLAVRAIAAGEEITVDYAVEPMDERCRRLIGQLWS